MKRVILVVDDEELNRNILFKFGTMNNYKVITAANGQKAIDILKENEDVSAVLLDIIMPIKDGYDVLKVMRSDERMKSIPVIVQTVDREGEKKALKYGANDCIIKPYDFEILKSKLENSIQLRENAAIVNSIQKDNLTGLYTRSAFLEIVEELVAKKEEGYYVLSCFDIEKFKVVNDLYGTNKGDEVLKIIAKHFIDFFSKYEGICCRVSADNYALLYPAVLMDSLQVETLKQQAIKLNGIIKSLTFSIGRYIIVDKSLSANAMYDRAMIAKATIKGRYDQHVALYEEKMREKILSEQEIVSEMNYALKEKQFEVWFQPQYDHENGALIGAEALVRWRHPEKGLISPGIFIPIFEKNGFVYEIDKFVWEQSCIFLRKMLEDGKTIMPISVNISRYDIFQDGMCEFIIELIQKYNLDAEMLRLEITESAFTNANKQIIDVVIQLKNNGFTVEIDDFGSGYSSLNTLKDVPADVLKLDMKFLEGENNADKGGNIVASIIRMAKWIGMSVIAEGVETIQQANFLRSIGCCYIQGYLYSKPLPQKEYEKIMSNSNKETSMITMEKVETYNIETFWNPASMDTLIFNSFVGGACIFEYYDGKVDLLRVNSKFVHIFGSGRLSESEILEVNVPDYISELDFKKAQQYIQKAIDTMEEVVTEIEFHNFWGNTKRLFIRLMARVIAKSDNRYLFYCLTDNITEQRTAERQKLEAERKEMESAQQLKIIMDNINGGVSAIIINDDASSKMVFNNERYYELYGYAKEQAMAEDLDVMTLIHPDDIQGVMNKVRKLKKDRIPTVIDYRCKRKDGKLVYLRANASMMSRSGYSSEVITSVITNITEQKLLTDQLKAVVNNINGGVTATIQKEGNPEFLIVNEQYFNHLGYTKEQYYDEVHDPFAPLYKEDRDRVIGLFDKSNQTRKKYTVEYRIVRRDKEIRWMRSNISVINFFGIDEPVQLAVANDITEQREAELKERMTADELKTVMNYAGNGITAVIMKEDENEFIFANEEYFKIIGYSRDEYNEMIKSNVYDVVHPDDRMMVFEKVKQVNEAKKDVELEFRIIRPDRKLVWVKTVINVISLYGIQTPVQVAVFTDITEEKEANDQLRFLNETAHDILAQPNCGKALNETLQKLLQYFGGDRSYVIEFNYESKTADNTYEICTKGISSEKENLQGIPFDDFTHIMRLLQKKRYFYIKDIARLTDEQEVERQILLEQGIVSIIMAPLYREQVMVGFVGVDNPSKELEKLERLMALGDYIAILMTKRDLEQQIQIEQAKQVKAEENQRELLDNLPCGAALYEFNGSDIKKIHINKSYWELVNRKPVYNKDFSVVNAIYKEDVQIALQEIKTAIRQGRNAVCDLRVKYGKTEYKPFHLVTSIRKKNEGVYTLFTTYAPISDKTMSIQELFPIAMSTMLEVSEDHAYMKDKELHYICCSQTASAAVGYENPRDVIGKSDYDLFDKKHADYFVQSDKQVLESGKAILNISEKIKSFKGKIHLVNTSKYPIIDMEGNVIGIYGISRDITEEKEKDFQMELLTNSIPGGLAAYSIKGKEVKTLFFNEGFYQFSGYTREEYINMTVQNPLALMFEEDRVKIHALLHKASGELKVGVGESCTFRCHTKDGGFRWMSMKTKLSWLENDEYILNVVQIDITEQKEIEESLRRTEEEYRLATKHSGRTIARYDIEKQMVEIEPGVADRLSLPQYIEDVPYGRVTLGKISSETADSYIEFYEKIMHGEKEGTVMFQKLLPTGWRWVNAHSTTIFSSDGRPVSALISYIDVTEQYDKEAIYRKWQQSLESRPDESFTLFRCDLSQDASFDSSEGRLISFDYEVDGNAMTFDKCTQKYAEENVYEEDRDKYIETLKTERLLEEFYRGRRNFSMEYREIITRDDYRWIRRTVDLVEKPAANGIMAYLMFEDIDESKKIEIKTQILAETDALTGLLNRVTFADKMNRMIRQRKEEMYFAFVLLDMDGFKQINDTFGHEMGDNVLIHTGHIISSILKECDLVGRLGGDEFIACICNVPNKDIIRKQIRRIWKMTHKSFGDDIKLSASLGVAICPDNGSNFETLYHKADKILYQVKDNGKDNYGFYREDEAGEVE